MLLSLGLVQSPVLAVTVLQAPEATLPLERSFHSATDALGL